MNIATSGTLLPAFARRCVSVAAVSRYPLGVLARHTCRFSFLHLGTLRVVLQVDHYVL